VSDRTIGEMSDTDARMVMLRASVAALGVVPEGAVRTRDGGYTLSLRLDPATLDDRLVCGAEVGIGYYLKGVCGRSLAHNYHRPDQECDDPEAHLSEAPFTLHHLFVVADGKVE
jgi:hypothetical protein